MALLARVTRRDSVLAFAPYHDFLAAGTMQEVIGEPTEISILSGAGDSGLELGYDYRFKEAVAFRLPGPVCCLAWSKAMWSFTMGLLAAGLVNGQVAVWNPRVRDTQEDEGYFDKDFPVDFDYDYLSAGRPQPRATLLRADGCSGNLAKDVAGEQSESEDEDASDWEVVTNYRSNMVAMFAKHVGPVRGLSFGYRSNALLASGGSHWRMLVWDLNDLSKDEIPTLEFTEGDGVDISSLSWSRADIIASASNTGTAIWDINVKSPLIRKLPQTRNSSAVEWSPSNQNRMVAAGYYYDLPSVQGGPVKQFYEDAKGFLALSWCPFDDVLLASCTGSNKIVLLDLKKGEVVHEMAAPGACLDIRWSRKSEDHFALSSLGRVDLYHRAPEI